MDPSTTIHSNLYLKQGWADWIEFRNTLDNSYFGINNPASQNRMEFYHMDNSGNPIFGILCLLNNGNVGIGTSTPSQNLEVVGNVKATKFIGDGSGLTGMSALLGNWVVNGKGINYSAGNVGIGTSTPSELLEVGNSGNISLMASGNDPGDILFKKSNGTQMGRIFSSNNGTNYLYFTTQASNTPNLAIDPSGNVGIGNGGCISPNAMLTVNGTIHAIEVDVTTTPCSDYVFEKNYNLMKLADLEKYVTDKKHLPEVPSANDYKANGSYSLSEMNNLLLKKVEELTLYIIEQNKRIDALEKINAPLKTTK